MNENERDRIAAAANQLRPDWPVASLRAVLSDPRIANRPRRDVAVALTWVACESDSRTPARVFEPGPWWVATGAESNESRRWMPPKDVDACPTHPGEWRERCRACAANQKAGDAAREERQQARSDKYAERADELRALVAAATAGYCRHGVDRARCADCLRAGRASETGATA